MPNDETAVAQLPAETTAAPTTADKISDAVNAWVSEHIHGSPVAQTTAAYNHLTSSLDALKAKLLQAIEE